MKKTLLLLFASSLGACGVRLGQKSGPETDYKPNVDAQYLEGAFVDSTGKARELREFRSKPLVLIFASDTCEVCAEEVENLKKSLRNSSEEPTEVSFLSLLVAAEIEDAQDWQGFHEVPWTVGQDRELRLFRQLCPGGQVPCVMVQDPKKGLVFRREGEVSVEELKKLTGGWN